MKRTITTRQDLADELSLTESCPYRTDFIRKAFFAGMAEGLTEVLRHRLLLALNNSGFAVPETVAARIANCWDCELLTLWIENAVTAETLDEVFVE